MVLDEQLTPGNVDKATTWAQHARSQPGDRRHVDNSLARETSTDKSIDRSNLYSLQPYGGEELSQLGA